LFLKYEDSVEESSMRYVRVVVSLGPRYRIPDQGFRSTKFLILYVMGISVLQSLK